MRTEHFSEWLRTQSDPLGILLAVLICALAALYLLAKGREFRLARKRAGCNVETFVDRIKREGADPVIARSVYEYLRKVQKVPFPMMPEDTLDEKLGLAGRSLQEAISDIFLRTGREARPGLTVGPPETLRDLVHYVEVSPKLGPEGRSQKTASGTFSSHHHEAHSSGTVRKANGK